MDAADIEEVSRGRRLGAEVRVAVRAAHDAQHTCSTCGCALEARDLGRLVIEIGMAPVKPAEFVIFRIFQWAPGQD